MKKLSILVLVLHVCLFAISQKANPPIIPEVDWKLTAIPTEISTAYNMETYTSFEKGIVYVSETEAVAPVYFEKDNSIIKINRNGKVMWTSLMPGQVKGVSKFNGNILAICA